MKFAFNRATSPALTFFLSCALQGAVVYNNGAPNQVSGTNMTEFQVADNFSLAVASDITTIRFWSIQQSPSDYTGSVYWAIYSNVATAPGVILQGGVTSAVAAVATGNSTGFGYLEYSFDIPVSFTLGIGDYWLGLHNGPLATTTPREMLWATTAVPVGSEGLYFDGTWLGTGNEHAFLLEGTTSGIPEPGSFALIASGLVAVAYLRRKS